MSIRARVVHGRWVLEDPVGLPEGTVVEIVTHSATLEIYIDDKIRQYIHAIIAAANATARPGIDHELVEHAKAVAVREKRAYVTPADVKIAAPEVLGRSPRIDEVLANTPVP